MAVGFSLQVPRPSLVKFLSFYLGALSQEL